MGCRSPQKPDNGVPGPGHYEWKDLTGAHRLAPSIHPHIEDLNARRVDVPYRDVRRFPEIKKKTIHSHCSVGSHWISGDSIPGPEWAPDSSLKQQPITIRNRIPDKPPGTDNPGPGAYTFPIDVLRSGEPKFTFKGPPTRDFWLPAGEGTPGPGHYKIEVQSGLPMWTIGDRTLQKAKKERARSTASKSRALSHSERRPSS
jgi:hypothetical protein